MQYSEKYFSKMNVKMGSNVNKKSSGGAKPPPPPRSSAHTSRVGRRQARTPASAFCNLFTPASLEAWRCLIEVLSEYSKQQQGPKPPETPRPDKGTP